MPAPQRYGTARGFIPERLKVYLRKPTTFMGFRESLVCQEAFYTNASSPSDVAERWAEFRNNGTPKIPAQERDNAPIPQLKLVGLDLRNEGGRAWKVLTPENHLVDLREDVFLDVLFETGVPADGTLQGPFRWVVYGSQVRLAIMGSALYRELEQAGKLRKSPKIKDSELVKGGVYHGINSADLKVFLGYTRYKNKPALVWCWLRNLENQTLQETFDSLLCFPCESTYSQSSIVMVGKVKLTRTKVTVSHTNDFDLNASDYQYDIEP